MNIFLSFLLSFINISDCMINSDIPKEIRCLSKMRQLHESLRSGLLSVYFNVYSAKYESVIVVIQTRYHHNCGGYYDGSDTISPQFVVVIVVVQIQWRIKIDVIHFNIAVQNGPNHRRFVKVIFFTNGGLPSVIWWLMPHFHGVLLRSCLRALSPLGF